MKLITKHIREPRLAPDPALRAHGTPWKPEEGDDGDEAGPATLDDLRGGKRESVATSP